MAHDPNEPHSKVERLKINPMAVRQQDSAQRALQSGLHDSHEASSWLEARQRSVYEHCNDAERPFARGKTTSAGSNYIDARKTPPKGVWGFVAYCSGHVRGSQFSCCKLVFASYSSLQNSAGNFFMSVSDSSLAERSVFHENMSEHCDAVTNAGCQQLYNISSLFLKGWTVLGYCMILLLMRTLLMTAFLFVVMISFSPAASSANSRKCQVIRELVSCLDLSEWFHLLHFLFMLSVYHGSGSSTVCGPPDISFLLIFLIFVRRLPNFSALHDRRDFEIIP